MKEEINISFDKIKDYIKELEQQLSAKENELMEFKKQASLLDNEKNEAARKLEQMEKEMSKLSSVYEEIKVRKDMEIDLQEIMRLYIILTEQVLDGSAHIKLLTLLHGEKERMTKTELTKATGIQPAATLRAIFDLRNSGLVTYDENNELVKLVHKLFT